jgi:4-hydroxy-3-methylbut-2-enyl diphosphate reductase
MINVEIDEGSGFCFGVTRAINKAEEELAKGHTLYCLGDIVHNGQECQRLEKLGLITINHQQLTNLHHAKVLFRAHGEPPETYEIARKNDIQLIDATCPVVLQLQKRIKSQYDNHVSGKEKQIVIYGKNGHAEVLGLVGQTKGEAIVLEHPDDVTRLDFSKDIYLYSQTTKSLEEFWKIINYIQEHISPNAVFEYYDTICRQVANRMPHLQEFAKAHELIFFVSGQKSSNGRILYHECQKVNPNTHFVSRPEDIEKSLLKDIQSVGVCGATSTPKWLMEACRKRILYLSEDEAKHNP